MALHIFTNQEFLSGVGGFMKKLHKITFLALIMLTFMYSTATAHEMWGGKRWHDTYYESLTKINYVKMKVNGSCLNSQWSSAYSTAKSVWNSDGGNAFLTETSLNSSEVDIANYTNWPTAWGADTVGVTFAKDGEGDWWVSWTNAGTYNTANGRYQYYAQIYMNPAYNNVALDIRRWAIAHELGHVMGLAHPSSSTQSVMHTGTVPTWTTYYKPKLHDRNDLSAFYN